MTTDRPASQEEIERNPITRLYALLAALDRLGVRASLSVYTNPGEGGDADDDDWFMLSRQSGRSAQTLLIMHDGGVVLAQGSPGSLAFGKTEQFVWSPEDFNPCVIAQTFASAAYGQCLN